MSFESLGGIRSKRNPRKNFMIEDASVRQREIVGLQAVTLMSQGDSVLRKIDVGSRSLMELFSLMCNNGNTLMVRVFADQVRRKLGISPQLQLVSANNTLLRSLTRQSRACSDGSIVCEQTGVTQNEGMRGFPVAEEV